MKARRHILSWCSGCAGVLLLFSGCSSIVDSHKQKTELMESYLAGNTDHVAQLVKKQEESTRDSGDELMWRLEAGSMYFYARDYAAALRSFEQAERLMAGYDQRAVLSARDVSAEAGAALTNLNAIPYRGWCRDRIMLPLFKAFAYLGQHDTDGFRVELKRMREAQDQAVANFQAAVAAETAEVEAQNAETRKKLKSVSNSYGDGVVSLEALRKDSEGGDALARVELAAKSGYGNFLNPLAVFFSGASYVRDGDWENALVDFKRLFEIRPDHPLWPRYYVTALQRTGREIPEEVQEVQPFAEPLDRDTVLVVIANGRGPAFRQVVVHLVLPYLGYTGFAFPVCEYYPRAASQFQVQTQDRSYATVPVADMDGIVSQEYTERLPGMITRTAVSYLAKEAASLVATQAAQATDNEWVVVAAFLGTGVYKYLFNTADTRSWELLPKEYQLVQLPMPQNRRLTISATGMAPLNVAIPAGVNSAIVYVNVPATTAVTWQLLEWN